MIKPSVGRVVLFFRQGEKEPFPALVTVVHDERTISVAVMDPERNGGEVRFMSRRALLQDDDKPVAQQNWCEWMPYQKSVASGETPAVLHATPKSA